MVERVSTGGTVSFDYKIAEEKKLSQKEKKEIDEAYERYYERKNEEKKKGIIIGTIIALIIIALILFFVFR